MLRRGAVARAIPIGEPRLLVAADLERLKQPRFVPPTPQKLRDSHHMIARLASIGLKNAEIAGRTGRSTASVTNLLQSPAMIELVAVYRQKIDDQFVASADEFFDLATRNMLAAERHIADRIADLDEAGELLSTREALAISRDAADRFGYGKKTQNTNINIDFAARLEQAIARSGKQIEGAIAQPMRTSQLVGASLSPSQPVTVSTPAVSSSPPIRPQHAEAPSQVRIRRRA